MWVFPESLVCLHAIKPSKRQMSWAASLKYLPNIFNQESFFPMDHLLRLVLYRMHVIKCWPIPTKGQAIQSPCLNNKRVQKHLLLKIRNYEWAKIWESEAWESGPRFDHYWVCDPHPFRTMQGMKQKVSTSLSNSHIFWNYFLRGSIVQISWY